MQKHNSHLIHLLNISGVGPRRTLELVKHIGSLNAIFEAKHEDLIKVSGITKKIATNILAAPDQKLIEGQDYLLNKYDVKMISIWDEGYPDLLKQIYDPPIVLFCRGDINLLKEKTIGLVGTRTPSSYGKEVTSEFAMSLADCGLTVCSGAARGVDTIAHRSVLKARGKTIAVLGNGLDRVYPAENKDLYQDLSKSGLMVSEFMMGTGPDAQNFPRRNRIISGLSLGTIVVEAAEKSGSLITAYFSLDQNREVFAVPGSIKSKQSKGTNQLIRQGAIPVTNIQQILEEFGERYALGSSKGQQVLKISVDSKEEALLALIPSEDSVHIDQLAEKSGLTTYSLLGLLLQMEMKGLVQQMPGKYFKRN